MSFYSCLVFGITSICLGALAGCLICVISAKITNKKYLRSRFAVSCVLLSVAVAMCAGGFVLIKDNEGDPDIEGNYYLLDIYSKDNQYITISISSKEIFDENDIPINYIIPNE